jgi:hypothetical protein
MIHELGDDQCLGKGVCGQLSTVLFASLRLAGVPCLMRWGYLSKDKKIDENMAHAWVSAVLPADDGSWRLKNLEAVRDEEEGLIRYRKAELERAQKGVVPHVDIAREVNKWGWLALEFQGAVSSLTNEDADYFYHEVTRCRGLNPVQSPTPTDVADAYVALLDVTQTDLIDAVKQALMSHSRFAPILERALEERGIAIKRFEVLNLKDLFS